MTSTKYIGMDVHKESISIAVRDDAGKLLMECVIETKAGNGNSSAHRLGERYFFALICNRTGQRIF
jgi:hypothetical protein